MKLEIEGTEIEPMENEWYHVKITFNTNKILSFFFKENMEITQFPPNSRPWGESNTTTPTDTYIFDGSDESIKELNKNL